MLQIAFTQSHPQPRMTCMRELLGASLLVKSTFQVDLKSLAMRPTAPENFDGDATTDRLDPTWKVQVDLIDPTRRSICGIAVICT